MSRSMEEIKLAANLVARASHLLDGIDYRTIPGDPPGLRSKVRGLSYDLAEISERFEKALGGE